jgi:zinc transport system permease protein
MLDALAQPFFQRVLIAGLLASLACGVLGTFIVAKRISSIAGGLAHAAFGGVGLGYLAGFSPMLGAAGFGVLSAVAIGLGARRMGAGLDTWISMVWALGMALGILFVALSPGYAPDLMSYLFGNLLFVSWDYVILIGALDLLIGLAVVWLFQDFRAVSFDEEFSEVVGVPVERLFLVLLVLIALGIVTLIRVVGVILVIALLTLPAAIARHWTDDLRHTMLVATAISVVCTAAGLCLSYALGALPGAGISLPPGPLVILLAAALYGASATAQRLAPAS